MSSFLLMLFSIDSLFFDSFFEKFSHHHFDFPFLFDGDDQIDQRICSQSRNYSLSGPQGHEYSFHFTCQATDRSVESGLPVATQVTIFLGDFGNATFR
jgi:hypothetical protein